MPTSTHCREGVSGTMLGSQRYAEGPLVNYSACDASEAVERPIQVLRPNHSIYETAVTTRFTDMGIGLVAIG